MSFQVGAFVCCALVSVLVSLNGRVDGRLFVFGFGSCPETPTQENFTLDQYLGTWYELERFDNWYEQNLKCVTATYTLPLNDTIAVLNNGIDTTTGEVETAEGTGVIPDPEKPAELRVTFFPISFFSSPNYFVVSTNYTDYAVVFSCFKFPIVPVHVLSAWILTRERETEPSNLTELKAVLESAGVDVSNFNSVNQTDCSG